MSAATTAPARGAISFDRPLYGYKKYNLINNVAGWACFIIAAVTYLLTLEPTASFWDCPEFISQGAKLEVGHPPGNPIFILAARFFINFAGGDVSHYAVAVNAMSGLLSAATILLLFWTITHLVRRMIVGRSKEALSLSQLLVVIGSGVCGALVYTWSDTFWFSAVEGEVYAFSSFCTALVFWLVLKWDTRADEPHADRYLILVAFVIGVSIGVHLLNLLTIPALALIIYYRKAQYLNNKPKLLKIAKVLMWIVTAIIFVLSITLVCNEYYGQGLLLLCVCSMSFFYRNSPTYCFSIFTLLLSFVVVALILYGLVPGFIEMASYFEIFCVNSLGMSYNIGVLIYAVMLFAALVWCISALYKQKSRWQIQLSFVLSVILSGIFLIGSSALIPVVLTSALVPYLCIVRKISIRFLTLAALSILVIFIGYTSYTLLLIRATAQPPMNQNAPDNVFTLSSYLNREQYGETPLLYGPSFTSEPEYTVTYYQTEDGRTVPQQTLRTQKGSAQYGKAVKTNPTDADLYVELKPKETPRMTPNMWFPRMYSQQPAHHAAYLDWIGVDSVQQMDKKLVPVYFNEKGEEFTMGMEDLRETVYTPSFKQNLRYFFDYQLNYMYLRYFLWNFAGRQNDLQGQGEWNRGNWITGISVLDDARLGDQSLLPPDQGSENKGHNVFYMLPLLMGLIGIAAQLMRGKEGICQFWIVMIFFFMTGIAIVLYLNQPPMQVRERDYAYAGSFYAFSIWIGMGVYGLWLLSRAIGSVIDDNRKFRVGMAALACLVGVLVPLQMVSQTWDDHDRSGRYTTRDFGMNYLSSLAPNAIIFTNGDNDTFPLWYAQEVEGYRTDVRVVNLSYLTTDWYANHQKLPSYDAAAIEFSAKRADYAFDRLQSFYVLGDDGGGYPVDVFSALNDLYTSPDADYNGIRVLRTGSMYIPVNVDDAVKAGIISEDEKVYADDYILVDWNDKRSATLSDALSLDMVAHGIYGNGNPGTGWRRPAYFAMTVPDEYYINLGPYLRNTGLAYQVSPIAEGSANSYAVATDTMYDNVMNKFRWGGLDSGKDIYLDETVRRMVTTHRSTLLDLASALYYEGIAAQGEETVDGETTETDSVVAPDQEYADQRFHMALNVLNLMENKLPKKLSPYSLQIGQQIGLLYIYIGKELGDNAAINKGLDVLLGEIETYAPYVGYIYSIYKAVPSNERLPLSKFDLYAPVYASQLENDYLEYGGDKAKLNAVLNKFGGNDYRKKLNYLMGE